MHLRQKGMLFENKCTLSLPNAKTILMLFFLNDIICRYLSPHFKDIQFNCKHSAVLKPICEHTQYKKNMFKEKYTLIYGINKTCISQAGKPIHKTKYHKKIHQPPTGQHVIPCIQPPIV